MNTAIRSSIIPLVLVFLFTQCQLANAQHDSVSPDIVRSFRTGNSLLLSSYFDDVIKISILDKEYETGKEEAIKILDTFFRNHRPVSFQIKFESEKKESKFIIASLVTGNGTFRVNIFFRKASSKEVIQLLRIEKENEASF